MTDRPAFLLDPVCGMRVDVAEAEADRLLVEYQGRTYAFCRAGCRSAFLEEPATYASRTDAQAAELRVHVDATAGDGGRPVIDEGMRRWYESCSCCLGDAYPEVKAQLDAERVAASKAAVDPGICELADAAVVATQ